MKVMIFSVLDRKTGAFMQPFFQLSRGQAMRTLMDGMEDANSVVGKHPEDFALYQVGMFDDEEGEVFPPIAERFVCNASDVQVRSVEPLREVK